jgi:hypothetical protein
MLKFEIGTDEFETLIHCFRNDSSSNAIHFAAWLNEWHIKFIPFDRDPNLVGAVIFDSEKEKLAFFLKHM